ncbi:MAG: PilZ domain-containing protein [Candidatus Aureabacteria bacterium]|nr:PilZ domain-containing protein [Candidatus Auribacterota bacterium]
MNNSEGLEKREYIRFPFNYPIQFRLKNTEEWFYSSTDNISLTGIMFASDVNYQKNDDLELELSHPSIESPPSPLIASVSWCVTEVPYISKIYVVGCTFKSLEENQKEYIKNIIHQCVLMKQHRTYKILFIDDNKSLTKLFKCLGEEYRFEAYTADNITEGKAAAVKIAPDVIITDIHLPDGDGFKLAAVLKTHERTRNIPIIAASVTYTDIGERFFLFGGSKFINDKPTTIEKLNRILEGVLPKLSPSPEKN